MNSLHSMQELQIGGAVLPLPPPENKFHDH